MAKKILHAAHRFGRRKLMLGFAALLLAFGGLTAFVTSANNPHGEGQAWWNPLNLFTGSVVYFKTGKSGGTLTPQDIQDTQTLRRLLDKFEVDSSR